MNADAEARRAIALGARREAGDPGSCCSEGGHSCPPVWGVEDRMLWLSGLKPPKGGTPTCCSVRIKIMITIRIKRGAVVLNLNLQHPVLTLTLGFLPLISENNEAIYDSSVVGRAGRELLRPEAMGRGALLGGRGGLHAGAPVG